MSRLANILLALTVAAGTAGAVTAARAEDAPSSAHRQTVFLKGTKPPVASPGSVNLQGFAQPITPGTLGPTQVQGAMVSVGGVNVGALREFGSDAEARVPAYGSATNGRTDNGFVGGYAGYRIPSTGESRSGYGVNLHFGTDGVGSSDTWRVQPSVDYTAALGSSWQLNSRLFSTYNLDGSSASGRTGSGEESGFRDIGLSFGLGYAPSESWTVQTQASYAVQLRNQDTARTNDKSESSNEFFGGVILNYRF